MKVYEKAVSRGPIQRMKDISAPGHFSPSSQVKSNNI